MSSQLECRYRITSPLSVLASKRQGKEALAIKVAGFVFLYALNLATAQSQPASQIPLMIRGIELPDPLYDLRRAEEIRALQLQNAEAERRVLTPTEN